MHSFSTRRKCETQLLSRLCERPPVLGHSKKVYSMALQRRSTNAKILHWASQGGEAKVGVGVGVRVGVEVGAEVSALKGKAVAAFRWIKFMECSLRSVLVYGVRFNNSMFSFGRAAVKKKDEE